MKEILFFMILVILIYSINSNKSYYDINNDLIKKINLLENNYRKLLNDPIIANTNPIIANTNPIIANPIDLDHRDRRVVSDYLYPPINRTERPLFDSLIYSIPTRGSPDTYRQIGIGRSDKNGRIFYLFGRQKYSGSSLGEYYLLSSDKHSGMQFKIPITKNIIKDYYNIPDKLVFDNNHKILPGEIINIEVLKNGELDSIYI